MRHWATFILLIQLLPFADPCAAQQDSLPEITFSVTPAGSERNVPGKWAMVGITGVNHTDRDVEETIVVSLDQGANLQFARRLWIPARARRQSWLPILIPDEIERNLTHLSMRSMRIKDAAGGEQFQTNEIGLPTTERLMLLSWDNSHAAALLDSTGEDDSFARTRDLFRWISEGRDLAVRSEQDLGVPRLTSTFLPTSPNVLDSIDQVIIAGNQILGDSTAVGHLRTWLRSGGRMWVMLDQVDQESVRRLLGDAASYTVVDEVEMNSFDMEPIAAHQSASKIRLEPWSSETPVKMLRVLADSTQVHCRINGWPAAFWQDVGEGEVLFTTLGPRGWFGQRGPLPVYVSLSERFFINRLAPPNYAVELARSLEHEIGYRIPKRSAVAAVLGIHLLVVFCAAVWFARRKNLQVMAWVIPVCALFAVGSLLAMGLRQTRAVPSTIVTGQIARISAEDAEVQVNSVAAIYSHFGRPLSIQAELNTTTTLSHDDLLGDLKRVVWDDHGRAHWMFVDQSPGVVRHVQIDATVPLPKTCRVLGHFTESGFEGRLEGIAAEQCQDPVIVAAAAPALSVKQRPGGSEMFRGGLADLLSPHQYIDDAIITDRQRYRQDMLRQLISADRPGFGRKPTFLAWADSIDSGVTFDDGYDRRGWVLMSIPIQLQRSPPGTDFKLPATFVRIEAYQGVSSAFNPRTGEWLQGMNRPLDEQLHCMVPLELLPCKLKRAELEIRVNAPSRTLEVKGLVNGRYVTLDRKKNPSGLLKFDIQRLDALELDGDGGLRLAIAISDSDEPPQPTSVQDESLHGDGTVELSEPDRNTWQIYFVRLNLEGTTR